MRSRNRGPGWEVSPSRPGPGWPVGSHGCVTGRSREAPTPARVPSSVTMRCHHRRAKPPGVQLRGSRISRRHPRNTGPGPGGAPREWDTTAPRSPVASRRPHRGASARRSHPRRAPPDDRRRAAGDRGRDAQPLPERRTRKRANRVAGSGVAATAGEDQTVVRLICSVPPSTTASAV